MSGGELGEKTTSTGRRHVETDASDRVLDPFYTADLHSVKAGGDDIPFSLSLSFFSFSKETRALLLLLSCARGWSRWGGAASAVRAELDGQVKIGRRRSFNLSLFLSPAGQ